MEPVSQPMGDAPSTAASQARPCATVVLRDDGMSSRYVSGIVIVIHEPPMHNWGVERGVPASEVEIGFKVDI